MDLWNVHPYMACFHSFLLQCLSQLTVSLQQRESSEVRGDASKPEHERLNPAAAPDPLVHPQSE